MSKQDKKHYRLGIDMGSTSIGWCMLELDKQEKPCGVINMGVRIFPDGRDEYHHTPLSVFRRKFRGQRRLYDRRRWRTQQLVNLLIQSGLLPKNENERKIEFQKDPLLLRKKALYEEISISEFGRILMHISKHRGFKSNRKAEKKENTKSKYKDAIENCLAKLAPGSDFKTLGEYLWNINEDKNKEEIHRLILKNKGVRFKKGDGTSHLKEPVKFSYKGAKNDNDIIFPTRDILLDEFIKLWDIQSRYHAELRNDELREKVRIIIFEQMKLKSQKHAIGNCYLYHNLKRCPKADPKFQEFRLWQTINNLRIIDSEENIERRLSYEEKQSIFTYLNTKASATFESIRKRLYSKESDRYKFTDESRKKSMLGNEIEALFRAKANSEILPIWDDMDSEIKSQVIEILIDNLDDEDQISYVEQKGISHKNAEKLISINIPSNLEGYCRLSLFALEQLLPYMRQGMMYSEACTAIGKSHSSAYTGEIFDSGDLPYYGKLLKRQSIPLNRPSNEPNADKYGKINNPTVHVALNQLGKVVNAICKQYGPPKAIHLEMGKDVPMSADERREIIKIQDENEKQNIDIANNISTKDNSIPLTKLNIVKYKLWIQISKNECERYCIYSGKNIKFTDVFSSITEIDHILPKSITYDDSMANKVLVYKSANDYKGNKTPYEAFHNSLDGYNWQDILNRVSTLPDNKKWRFLNNAMELFLTDKDPIARMMGDTRYMAVAAREYLSYICDEDNVISCTGRLTYNLRHGWGLNSILNDDSNEKNRTDHRHHAIDAFVIAMTDRATVKRFADSVKDSKSRFLDKLPQPYPEYKHEELQQKVGSIIVSFKPDQPKPQNLIKRMQTAGGLSKETAYSYIGQDQDNPKLGIYCVRQDVTSLTTKNVADVKDPVIKAKLSELLSKCSDEKEFRQKLPEWAKQHNIKKVKVLERANPKSMIPVFNKQGKVYKYYASDENLFADIYNPRPFDPNSKWQIEIVKSYDAHQKDFVPEWKKQFPMGKLVMRVYKNDIIALEYFTGVRELRRVRKMSKGLLWLAELNIAKKDEKLIDKEKKSVNQLYAMNACKAGVDVIGRCNDPNKLSNEYH